MKQILVIIFALIQSASFGQNKIEWDGKYQLKLSDFQSPATQIGNVEMYSIQTGSSFDFQYIMNSVEFMITKNFNGKVDCYFSRNVATLIAPDTTIAKDLLAFAQYTFDLSELYARKLRKSLYENKNAFSKFNYFRKYYDQIQSEYIEQYSKAGKITNIGKNHIKLNELHKKVLDEIQELSEFCKTCKPKKTRHKRKHKGL